MSGIFKGDSIYKSGGGGGGYKDGGQLVDGDFIEVENNTISSYDNVSRDPVNFYFEVKDGEVLNSVIELTTAVNATVNVYVVKNGIYYLLGNIGGNSVVSGNDYKINIVGDSYSIENVSSSLVPSYLDIEGNIYTLKKIGNLVWTCENLKGTNYEHYTVNGTDYYKINANINVNGWRLPTHSECTDLLNYFSYTELKSTTGWYNGQNGDNASGFNLYPKSTYKPENPITSNNPMVQWDGSLMCTSAGSGAYCKLSYNKTSFTYVNNPGTATIPVRLVQEL